MPSQISHLAMTARPTNNVRIYRVGSQHYFRKNVGRKEEDLGKVIQAHREHGWNVCTLPIFFEDQLHKDKFSYIYIYIY